MHLTVFSLSQTPRGRVQIQDGTLVTDKGTLLRGCYVAIDSDLPMTSLKEELKSIKDFGLNTLHVYADCQFPGEQIVNIDSIVKWTENDSLYLVLTVGWWGGPDLGCISGFWREFASKYNDKTHVIFEIANEPFQWSAPYDSITLAMEKRMYDTIRFYAPETHIQFMSYSENINAHSAILDFKSMGEEIDWRNASIAAHGYYHSSETTREFIREIQDSGYAITITEVPVIRAQPESRDFYPNLAFIRVFEEEFVSYLHLLEPYQILGEPSRYKTKIESSEIRWDPDFGTWPADLTQINYLNPYSPVKPLFYDEATYGILYGHEFNIFIDTIYTDDPYVAYYNLDFEDGPDTLLIGTSYIHNDSRAEVHLDSLNGPLIGSCYLPASPYKNDVVFVYPVTHFEGVHNIYIVFQSDTYLRCLIHDILFVKPGTNSKQPPYLGKAFEVPGKIEAEEYDIGGNNISFSDNTEENEGIYWIRFDEVDVEQTSDIGGGYNVGWIEEGEWLEYTINCKNTYVMDIQLRIACTDPGEKIRIKINNETLGTVELPNTYGWQNWEIITFEDVIIPAGDNQVLRLEFLDSGFNINWLNFIEKKVIGIDETNDTKITFFPNPTEEFITVKSSEKAILEIYNIYGQLEIPKHIVEDNMIMLLNDLISGYYIVKITSNNEVYSEILIVNNNR